MPRQLRKCLDSAGAVAARSLGWIATFFRSSPRQREDFESAEVVEQVQEEAVPGGAIQGQSDSRWSTVARRKGTQTPSGRLW
jgi:hypothetical protein